jgi:succinoglycan biosynthesis transport protein ExoP
MPSQPLQNKNNHEFEALAPVDPLPLNGQLLNPQYHLVQPLHPLLHYWEVLRKRKWIVLATFAIVFTISAVATLSETRLYQATSKVAIFPEVPNVLGFKDTEEVGQDYELDATMQTQIAILKSDSLALKVIENMRLYQDSRFTTVKPQAETAMPESSMQPDPAQAAALLGAFRGGLSVVLIPNTRLIQVSYTHPNPQFATDVSNNLVKTFIEENFRTKYASASQTSDWLSRELDDLQAKVQTSEEKLVRYQKDHGIVGVDEKQNTVTEKLVELNRELTQAETDRIEKEAEYKLAMEGDPEFFSKVTATGRTETGLIDKLREKESDLETQYALATTQFGSGYPKVTELSNQLKQVRTAIEAEKNRIREKMRDEYLAALQRENLLENAFNLQKQEENKLNESAIEYTVLKRDAEANRQLYQDLLQRLKEAGVSAGLRSSNIRVVDIARVPTFPISPNVQRSLVLGFLFGLSLGIGLAFVVETFDSTIRSIDEVRTVSTLPALATIPLQLATDGPLRKRALPIAGNGEKPAVVGLVTYERPKSEAAEAYRALRTSILLSSFGAPPKVILVTSAMPQEGKTTISANSALVLAQRGSRVLLVDADLRRPGVGKMLGLAPHKGLSSLITGSCTSDEAILRFSEVPNLWVLPAGPIPPQPAELLGSAVMRDLIARWRDEFDHIIIDTPPCLSVTDAVLLSPEADRVIMVARSGQTTRPALRRACDLLMQVNAKVMGIVLNALNLNSVEGYYYYGGAYTNSYYNDESTNGKPSVTADKVS